MAHYYFVVVLVAPLLLPVTHTEGRESRREDKIANHSDRDSWGGGEPNKTTAKKRRHLHWLPTWNEGYRHNFMIDGYKKLCSQPMFRNVSSISPFIMYRLKDLSTYLPTYSTISLLRHPSPYLVTQFSLTINS